MGESKKLSANIKPSLQGAIISHEINNSLSFLSNSLDTISQNLKEQEELLNQLISICNSNNLNEKTTALLKKYDMVELHEDLIAAMDVAKIGIKRIKNISASFKNFSQLANQSGTCSIAQLLNELKTFYYNSPININPHPVPLTSETNISYDFLFQVLVNLIQNSIDVLILKKITSPIKILYDSDEHNHYITVIDQGGPIDPKHIDHIFSPHFSTKDKSQNSGLGLYLSRMILRENQGNLSLIPSSGSDTGFKISLPVK